MNLPSGTDSEKETSKDYLKLSLRTWERVITLMTKKSSIVTKMNKSKVTTQHFNPMEMTKRTKMIYSKFFIREEINATLSRVVSPAAKMVMIMITKPFWNR